MKSLKMRRSIGVGMVAAIIGVGILAYEEFYVPTPTAITTDSSTEGLPAAQALEALPVKGRAPKTGYTRAQFGGGWQKLACSDMRNAILARDLHNAILNDKCQVISGRLADPYTAKDITFVRGDATSDDVQIDHVVALSDAWQKGAQLLTPAQREQLANDPLELLAVEGKINQEKGDSDAATWLPPNKSFRCQYVARQIAVKRKYALWVTSAEKHAMTRVLGTCPDQKLPGS